MEAPGKTLSRYRGFDGPGRWLPWISVAVYCISSYAGLRLSEGFHFSPPGDERPWYFLRNDFVIGTSLAVGIAVCLVIAYLARKRYPVNASACLWMSVLCSGGSAWKAAVIWMGSHNLMNPDLATTRWPNFEAYFGDPVIWAGQILILGGMVLFAERRLRRAG